MLSVLLKVERVAGGYLVLCSDETGTQKEKFAYLRTPYTRLKRIAFHLPVARLISLSQPLCYVGLYFHEATGQHTAVLTSSLTELKGTKSNKQLVAVGRFEPEDFIQAVKSCAF